MISNLNSVVLNTSFDGLKVTLVPVSFDLPTISKGVTAVPGISLPISLSKAYSNLCLYILPF